MPGGAAGAPMPRSDLSCCEATGAALAGAAGTDDFSLGGGVAPQQLLPTLAAAASNAGTWWESMVLRYCHGRCFRVATSASALCRVRNRPFLAYHREVRSRFISRGLSVDGCVSLIVDLSD